MTTTDPTVDTAALLAAETARATAHLREGLAVTAVDALQALLDSFKSPVISTFEVNTSNALSSANGVLASARRAIKDLR